MAKHSRLNSQEQQLDLFGLVADVYDSADRPVSNCDVYEHVKQRTGTNGQMKSFGSESSKRNTLEHKVRWIQQELKRIGVIENVKRGHWSVTKSRKIELIKINADKHVLAMNTGLGVVIWSRQENLFEKIQFEEPIDLYITSPPYPIVVPRAYGEIAEREMVDFICRTLEPIVPKLVRGGNIALNIGLCNEYKSPAKSMYPERLAVALHDRLGLKKMANIIWRSNKNPVSSGYHATRAKTNLMNEYEHVYWFTNDPHATFVDTRVIAEPHTESHLDYIANGGVKSASSYSDGAYTRRPGDYSTLNQGRLPRDVWDISNYCARNRAVNNYAKRHNLPTHGAKMPYELAHRAISLLSREGKMVVDTMAGTLTTAHAANDLNRPWFVCEQMLEYIQQGFSRFFSDSSAYFNPRLALGRP